MPLGAIGPYELLNELGRGGAGVVFRARDARSGREVALKLLGRERAPNPVARGRFSREVAALTRLRHPAIVPVLDAGEHEGRLWLAMELVPGESLAAWLERHGPFVPREAASLVHDLARALEAAHARGIVHRDLKPANVIRTPGGGVVLTDFGLTKELDSESEGLSRTGQLLGSPGYWAPEQALGERDRMGELEVDVWGLGATLYALLTARPPFVARELVEAIAEADRGTVVPPTVHRPGVPAALEMICLRCLARSPRERYASASEVAAELELFLAGRAPLGRRAGSRRGGRALVVTGALAALAGLALAFAPSRPEPAPAPPAAIVSVPPAAPASTSQALRLVRRVPLPRRCDERSRAAWSPDGTRVLISWASGWIELRETREWRVVGAIGGEQYANHEGLGLAWSGDGELAVIAALGRSEAWIQDMRGKLPVESGDLPVRGAPVFAWRSPPVFLPREPIGQRMLAWAGRPEQAGTWLQEVLVASAQAEGEGPRIGLRRLELDVEGPIATSRDGRWLLVTARSQHREQGRPEGEVLDRFTLHDLRGEREPQSLRVRSPNVTHAPFVQVSPDGRAWGAITSDGRLVAARSGQPLEPTPSWRPHGGQMVRLCFSGDSRHLVTWSRDALAVWRTSVWPWEKALEHTLEAAANLEVTASPTDGRILALEPAGLVVYELEPARAR